MKKIALFFAVAVCCTTSIYADDFGSWLDLQLSHKFSDKVYSSIRFEHRTKNNLNDLDVWFIRPTIGYNLTSWLKADVAYDFLRNETSTTHRSLVALTGTLRQGNLSASIKERWQYAYTPDTHTGSNTLRSKFTVAYSIPNTAFKPYVAMEVFTKKKWDKTRHYVGTEIRLNKHSSLDVFYMWYTFANKDDAEHVAGLGYHLSL